MFFRTVPSASTLVRWVNENAFASRLQARPCPTFGRPVHLEFPHRLRPGTSPHALRIPSCDLLLDGHPALRRTVSGGSRSVLAVSGFRLRARLDPSIPSTFSGQRGITPAFGYSAPHSSARGTLTLLSNALLSTHSRNPTSDLRSKPDSARTTVLITLFALSSPNALKRFPCLMV